MEWNEPLFQTGSGGKAHIGVLVSHGFSGSPCSVQELALRLADAGYTVAMPLLTGHGYNPEEMEKVLWTDWTADAEQAFAWLQERVDLVFATGLSMGGTLALYLAERHPEVAGVVTINALIRHPQELLMLAAGWLRLPRWVKPVGNDSKLPGVDEKAYNRIPSRAARQLALLLAAVRRDLPLVRCPALVFSSTEDHVVPPDNQREIYETIASIDKTVVALPDSYHVATMDNDKELVFAKTLEFIADRSRGL
ncbi:MAG: alpha/beta fold hydrolase [Thermoleophilia bacterium]|nr:alpha/beta fold hydrolase [Thermoleophilia bacterium]